MKEKYQVSFRKYRPQTFGEVIGQGTVIQTLKNAIKLSRIANAYLFSGSRGIGKTTIARLFAKAINCEKLTQDFEPCNKCRSCLEISSFCSLDVIEIDGASNRGIDDIRQINETINYAPANGKYKIYIIDEVHMLTKEAFNALLKTLEEPPKTIKFIFATTEPHKVLPTILSRCQRFDLVRLAHEEIIKKLEGIITDSKREADRAALHTIADFSDGSMRDAESILDQLLCLEEKAISTEAVHRLLGLTPKAFFFQFDEAYKERDFSFPFTLADSLYSSGKDLYHFVEELLEHFRYLLLFKIGRAPKHLPSEIFEKYTYSAQNYEREELIFILDLLISFLPGMQKAVSKPIYLEMLLMKILKSKNHLPLDAIVRKMIELERGLKKYSEATIESPPQNNKMQVTTNEEIKLSKVPFSITDDVSKINPKSPTYHYDTILNFASVELDGVIKKEEN